MPIVRTAIGWIGRVAANVNRILAKVLSRNAGAADEVRPAPIDQVRPEPIEQAQPEPVQQAQPAPIDQAQPEPVHRAQPELVHQPQPVPIQQARPAQIDTAPSPALPMEFEWGRIEGVYRGGWAGPQVTLHHGAGSDERVVDIEFEAPTSVGPHPTEIVVTKASDRSIARYKIFGGEGSKIRISLTEKPGRADIVIHPSVCLTEMPRGIVANEARELAIRVRKIEAGNVRKLSCIFDGGRPAPHARSSSHVAP
jgi:hypothetical protein